MHFRDVRIEYVELSYFHRGVLQFCEKKSAKNRHLSIFFANVKCGRERGKRSCRAIAGRRSRRSPSTRPLRKKKRSPELPVGSYFRFVWLTQQKKRKTWRERRVSHPLRPPYAEKRKEAKVVEPKKCSNEAWKASARSELNCLRLRVRFPFINGLVSVSVHMSMSWVQLCLIDSVS